MVNTKYDMYYISTIESMLDDLKKQYNDSIEFYSKNKVYDNDEYNKILKNFKFYISELQEIYFYYKSYWNFNERVIEISIEIKRLYEFINNYSF